MNKRLCFLIVLSLTGLTYADGPRMPSQVPERYTAECAACHVAYPPGFLPAQSWQRIMGGLEKHYGSDATMDADSVRQISAWLTANSGTGRRMREAPQRIESPVQAGLSASIARLIPARGSTPKFAVQLSARLVMFRQHKDSLMTIRFACHVDAF